MAVDLTYGFGQTPLSEDENDGLKVSTIATKAELDDFEQHNIELGLGWVLGKKLTGRQLFSSVFVKQLHQKMYGLVWSWAGLFRETNKNIGVDKRDIAGQLHMLLEDALFWLEHKTFPPDEVALRFKHRLVSIHCFPNGNGRHSRLMADVVARHIFGLPFFSWGAMSEKDPKARRSAYIKALQAADQGDIRPLLAFARS